MPQYAYRCHDLQGKKYKGTVISQDKSSAMDDLRRRKWVVVELKEHRAQWYEKEIYIGKPVKNQDFVAYCRQFATLIRSGISILDSNRIMSEQSESKPLKKALAEVTIDLRRGLPFSQALATHKRIFPPIFVNMVRAGEETGNMEDTLDRLATFFEKEHFTREKVKSAMSYPTIVGLIAILVVVYLLKFVVPRFVGIFNDLGSDLPWTTKLVVNLSNSISQQWYYWLLGVVAVVIVFQLFKKSPRGGYILDWVKLRVPVFGKLNQKSSIAQVTRTLASLYASSVPVLQSLSIVENVVGNQVISKYLRQSQESLRQGLPLSEPLKNTWVFPPLVSQMIAIGEETGSLDTMLGKIADFYEKDVENTVDRLKSLIEPLMILVLSGVVGFIVASILLPMFSIYDTIQ